MTVVLRLGRNQSAWEDGTVEELLRLAFSTRTGEPDLKLSVYLVEPAQLTQARVEHLVSETNPAITITTADLDLAGLAEPVQTPGATAFRFTRDEAHAELRLESVARLKELISQIKAEPPRRLARDRETLMAFILERDEEGDLEWRALLARPEKARWRELINKIKSKRPAPV